METTGKDSGKVPATTRNLDGYGAPTIPWEKVYQRLEQGIEQGPGAGGPDRHTCWLTTINSDGSPHVVPLGILWENGVFYFNSGPGARKAENLAQDSRCTLSVATHDFDLVIEGKGEKVTDQAAVQHIAELYRAVGWEATVDDSGSALTAPYSAPSAGPPPWYVYKLTPSKVYAFGTADPYGATRWTFK